MALNKMKKLIEDLEQGSTLVMAAAAKAATGATLATSAGYAGTSYKASTADYAGTARIAQWGSAGTGALA